MRVLRPTSIWARVAREPLVHFAIVGAILFAVDTARRAANPERPAPRVTASQAPAHGPEAPIVVDDTVRAAIASRAETRLGRTPSASELDAELDAWIDDEVLYREGARRGLDRFDPVIHKRVASRMSYVLEQAVIVPEPTDADLTAWFETHRERWSTPERVDFTHVFVAGTDAAARSRAEKLAAALAAGAAPERLGDRFSGGHRYRGRPLAKLARSFGDGFVRGLERQPPGVWVERASRFGLHLVRVDRVEPARPADFAAARLDVRKAWRDEQRRIGVATELARLRASWEIDRR